MKRSLPPTRRIRGIAKDPGDRPLAPPLQQGADESGDELAGTAATSLDPGLCEWLKTCDEPVFQAFCKNIQVDPTKLAADIGRTTKATRARTNAKRGSAMQEADMMMTIMGGETVATHPDVAEEVRIKTRTSIEVLARSAPTAGQRAAAVSTLRRIDMTNHIQAGLGIAMRGRSGGLGIDRLKMIRGAR